MVSYYNPLAMYRHQQQTTQCSPGTATWYPQPPQHPQYITSCMSDVDPHTVGTHWPSAETHKFLSPHHPAFPADWPQDCNHFQQPSPPISDVSSPGAEGLTTPTPVMMPERPVPVRSPYEWMKKTSYQSQPNPDGRRLYPLFLVGVVSLLHRLSFITAYGVVVIRTKFMHSGGRSSSFGHSSNKDSKTRTKDKYRVVYTDHQRLELEKEFHYSRYITIRRKAELASNLGLSERQVKIWFQNRRAKERKIVKKKMECPNLKKEVDLTGPVGIGIPSPLHHMQNGVGMPGGMSLM